MTFGGNTLVDIAPREKGKGFELFLRDQLKAGAAPMTKVTRYTAPSLVTW